ncbi:MAG TPA: TolC family protein [Lacipirellulaceae bacterium]|nr:TolC family protein [Lacipirellulaceae bacterium]
MQLLRLCSPIVFLAVASCAASAAPAAPSGNAPPLLQPPSVTDTEPAQQPPASASTAPSAQNAVEALPPGASGPTKATPSKLADFEAIALASNPALARANARVRAAQGKWVQVGLAPNPTAGYAASEIGDEGRAGQQGAVIGQEFVLGGKLDLNRAVAAKELQQAQQQSDAQRQRVINDVRIQFYRVLIAQEKVTLAERLVKIGGQAVDTTERLFKAQDASRADLLQARIESNSARILAENAGNERLSAWRAMAAVIGQPELPLSPVSGELHDGLTKIEWNDALQTVLSMSPEVAIARSEVERARCSLSRAQAEPIPNVDLQLTAQHDNATSDDIVGVQAVFPIPIWNRNQGGISQAQGELAAAASNVSRVELSLQQRLATAYARYANARQQVDHYEKEILPDAQSSLDLVNEGYRQGEFYFLGLLTAQRTYFQMNLAYLDALLQLHESSIEIDGMLLRGSLQSAE